MYDTVTLPRTPAMARRVVEYGEVNGSEVPSSLQSLAQTDVIGGEQLDNLPITPTKSQTSALQYLRDRDGKAVVVTQAESVARATAINYITLNQFERVLIVVSNTELNSLYEQMVHFLGQPWKIDTNRSRGDTWSEDTNILLTAQSLVDNEDVLGFDPDWVALFAPESTSFDTLHLPYESISTEWPSATLFWQIPPRLVREKTVSKVVDALSWNQCSGLMDHAIEFLPGSRLLKAMRSHGTFSTKFKDRNVPESTYADWLRITGLNFDLVLEKEYTHRIWREKYMQVSCGTPYGTIDEERAQDIRSNRSKLSNKEQNAWKQRKAIEEFERVSGGNIYDVLSDWVLNNQLPENVSMDNLIEAYQNLRRGNWIKDKTTNLVNPIVMNDARTILIANSGVVFNEIRHTFGIRQILDGKLPTTDTRVQGMIANFRDAQQSRSPGFGRSGGAHIMAVNFEYAEETDILSLADRVFWIEYPVNYMQFENIRTAAEKVSVPLIFTHLKGTWEDALLSVLLERDYTS